MRHQNKFDGVSWLEFHFGLVELRIDNKQDGDPTINEDGHKNTQTHNIA